MERAIVIDAHYAAPLLGAHLDKRLYAAADDPGVGKTGIHATEVLQRARKRLCDGGLE